MSAFPHLPLFTDAFIADTVHLNAQETGAYLMLMMVAWRSDECRLPDDDDRLSRFARVDRRTWVRIKPSVMGYWTLADGFWTQKRLTKEREFVSKRAEVNRENGKRGGRPKSLENNDEKNPAGSSRVSETKAPIPIPIPIKKDLPQDPNGSSPPKGAKATRKHRLPDDWMPGQVSEAAAAKAKRDQSWMLETAEDMRIWAGSTGSTRENWDLVHAGWMRREAKKEDAERERRGSSAKVHPFPKRQSPAGDRADLLQALMNGGPDVSPVNDQREFDHGRVIEHQGDGRHDRDLPRPAGGGAGRFSEEGYRRLALPERR